MSFEIFIFFLSFFSGVVTAFDCQAEVEKLKQEVITLKNERKVYDDNQKHMAMEMRKLKQQITDFQMLRNKRADQAAPHKAIAFSARLNHDIGNIKDDQILLFDHVITNKGDNYNNRKGIFHCDEAGLYVFYLSIVSSRRSYVTAQIARNHQGEAWTFSLDSDTSSSGSGMVVLQLQAGDAVYARINGNHHSEVGGLSVAMPYSSFSGFRID